MNKSLSSALAAAPTPAAAALALIERARERCDRARTWEIEVLATSAPVAGRRPILDEERWLLRYRAAPESRLYHKGLAGPGEGGESLATPQGGELWDGRRFTATPSPSPPWVFERLFHHIFLAEMDESALRAARRRRPPAAWVTPCWRRGHEAFHVWATWVQWPGELPVTSEWWLRRRDAAVLERRLLAPATVFITDVSGGPLYERRWVVLGERLDAPLPESAFRVRRR